jgi:hypothetical protein
MSLISTDYGVDRASALLSSLRIPYDAKQRLEAYSSFVPGRSPFICNWYSFSIFFDFFSFWSLSTRNRRTYFQVDIFSHSWSYKEWYRMNLTLSLQIHQHSSQDEAQVRISRGVYMGTGAFIIS